MAFIDVLFPSTISRGSTGGPQFSTGILVSDSGKEERFAHWSMARHRYQAEFGILNATDLRDVIDLYYTTLGSVHSFKYLDWADCTTAATSYDNTKLGGDAPAEDDVIIGTGDGTTAIFQLVKTYSRGSVIQTRTITKPENGTVLVAVDGNSKTEGTHYSVNYTTGEVTFTAGNIPASNESITAGCRFYVHVRFDTVPDEILNANFEAFQAARMSVPLIEVIDETPVRADMPPSGGGDGTTYASISTDVTLSESDARTIRMTPTAAINCFLPLGDDLEMGPRYIIHNAGGVGNDVTVKTKGGTTVGTIQDNQTKQLLLAEDSSATRIWIIF